MLKEERLPHQLRVQSRQIDNVLRHRQLSAEVAGGTVTQRAIHFDLHSHFSSGLERLRELKQDFLDALGVADVQLARKDGQWQLQINRPEEPPVALLDLLPLLPDIGSATAVLGVSEANEPLLIDLTDEDQSHMLLIGDSGAGKTTLLRSLAVSLALTNKQSQLQLVIIDANDRADAGGFTDLEPLSYLPHLLEPVVRDAATSVELLSFLLREMTYRLEQGVRTPVIVVLIDHLATLLEKTGETGAAALMQLVQKGPMAGIHLIMTTTQPESDLLTAVFKSTVPVRLVGRMQDEQAGLAATGDSNLRPEYFWGSGDFAAIVNGDAIYFQAAYIGDYDLHLTIDLLHRRRPRPILAKTFDVRQAATLVEEPVQPPEEILHFTPEGKVQPKTKQAAVKQTADDDEIPFDAGFGWDLAQEDSLEA
ncbi:MAG: AAA family ATPase [Anaerolineales bacterium]|nr:AAA family ATPase [Anaerolineales bacterium]